MPGTYRNRTLLSIPYATGAKVQEICDIKVGNIYFSDNTFIKLLGKGNMAREVIIPAQCTSLLKAYLSYEDKLDSLDSHFFSQANEQITISCVEEIVKKYMRIAKKEKPLLFREKSYAPHSFKHLFAVHICWNPGSRFP